MADKNKKAGADKNKKACVACFSNHKGGVGKTCSACNLGACLANRGNKVLLVDLDPQANLSLSLGVKDADRSIYHVMTGEVTVMDIMIGLGENLDLIPSSLDLAGIEVELSSEPGREMVLKELLEPLTSKYDFIFIDCPPTLGLLTTNALTASTDVYIPLQAEYLALQGMTKLTAIVEKVKKRLNKGLRIGGVFLTQFDSRKVLNRDIADAIEECYKDASFKTKIRDNVALAEAPGSGKDIFRYGPKTKGAEDYNDLCDEFLERYAQRAGR